MRRTSLPVLVSLLALAGVTLPGDSSAAGSDPVCFCSYIKIDLGSSTDRQDPVVLNVRGINDLRQVVGFTGPQNASQRERAFQWTEGSGVVELGTLSLPDHEISQAFAINNAGQVVGLSCSIIGERHAFAWEAGPGMIDLGEGIAFDINEAGLATGSGGSGPFLWEASTGRFDLTPIAPATRVSPAAINNAGQVAGAALFPPAPCCAATAFLWDPNSGILSLGASNPNGPPAEAINDAGQVVGTTQIIAPNGFPQPRAYLWETLTGITLLDPIGSINGFSKGYAHDINNLGQVVGSTTVVNGEAHAFVWEEGAGMIDLGTLPGENGSEARAINNDGWIAGQSGKRGVLWKPLGAGTPVERILVLIEDVQCLRDQGAINHGQARGLTAKLEAALASLESYQVNASQNQLLAFANQIAGFIPRTLSDAQGQMLIGEVNTIWDLLNEA